jgi:hypothetical protein
MGPMLLHHYRGVRTVRMTRFPTDLDAITALASGVLCRPDCVSHTIGYSTEAGITLVCFDTPRSTELETLYCRPRGGRLGTVENWPTPTEFNARLDDAPHRSELAERLDRGAVVELQRQLAPGRPRGRVFECEICQRVFDPGETVMFAQRDAADYRNPVHLVHPNCCPDEWRRGRAERGYTRRVCDGCGRAMIVRRTSPRLGCAPKCRQRVWRAAAGR